MAHKSATFFIMHRTGTFTPSKATKNQCKSAFHSEYHYHLRLVFPGDLPLDEQKFLIDHNKINKLITELPLKGSCEQMHLHLNKYVSKLMKMKGIDLLAVKCTIDPVLPRGPAWLEFVSLKSERYAYCLALLS